jgi:hypothetical protein
MFHKVLFLLYFSRDLAPEAFGLEVFFIGGYPLLKRPAIPACVGTI